MSKCFIGLIPLSSLPPNVQSSERKVHVALATALPSCWSAWHSLKIRTKTGEFSEADFVITDPVRGIIVLEVKGGSIRNEGGIWLQNGRPLKAAPLDQAHRFVRTLIAKAKELWCESWPAAMRLSGVVKGRREACVRLDREQFTTVESVLDNDLVLVRGGARRRRIRS